MIYVGDVASLHRRDRTPQGFATSYRGAGGLFARCSCAEDEVVSEIPWRHVVALLRSDAHSCDQSKMLSGVGHPSLFSTRVAWALYVCGRWLHVSFSGVDRAKQMAKEGMPFLADQLLFVCVRCIDRPSQLALGDGSLWCTSYAQQCVRF